MTNLKWVDAEYAEPNIGSHVHIYTMDDDFTMAVYLGDGVFNMEGKLLREEVKHWAYERRYD